MPDRDPSGLPRDAVPDYANGETDSTLHGRPFRRFVRACPRGWLVSAVAVSCRDCGTVQHFYGEPDVSRGQMFLQARAEGWTFVQVPKADDQGVSLLWVCPSCSMRRPRIGKRRRDWYVDEPAQPGLHIYPGDTDTHENIR